GGDDGLVGAPDAGGCALRRGLPPGPPPARRAPGAILGGRRRCAGPERRGASDVGLDRGAGPAVIQTEPRPAEIAIEIPPEDDPRLVDGAGQQRLRLGRLSPAHRAALVLERYPELRALPTCNWERLSTWAVCGSL